MILELQGTGFIWSCSSVQAVNISQLRVTSDALFRYACHTNVRSVGGQERRKNRIVDIDWSLELFANGSGSFLQVGITDRGIEIQSRFFNTLKLFQIQ